MTSGGGLVLERMLLVAEPWSSGSPFRAFILPTLWNIRLYCHPHVTGKFCVPSSQDQAGPKTATFIHPSHWRAGPASLSQCPPPSPGVGSPRVHPHSPTPQLSTRAVCWEEEGPGSLWLAIFQMLLTGYPNSWLTRILFFHKTNSWVNSSNFYIEEPR